MAIIPGLMSYSYHLSWASGAMTPRRFMHRAAELGLRTVEWCHFPCHAPGQVDWDQVHLLKGLGDELGIACQVSGFAPLLASEDERDQLEGMVATQLEVSRAIGARVLRFDGMLNSQMHIGDQAPMALCTDNLKRVVEMGQEADIAIALEDHMDFRAGDFRHFLSQIDSPYLGITLDTGNLMPVQEDAVAFAREFALRIINCHLKGVGYVFEDYGAVLTSVEPERSIVDLRVILQVFAQQPQDITVQIEVVAMEAEGEDPLVGQYAEFLTGFLGEAEAAAPAAQAGGQPTSGQQEAQPCT